MSPRDRALPTFAPSAGETLIGLDALRTRMGVVPPDRIVVGTSGGADSLTLLLTLRTLGFDVIAAHLDHQIRAESAADADFVHAFCSRQGIAFTLGAENVPVEARRTGRSIEDIGRRLRYRFLFDVAGRERAAAVAVGHHADDRAETVLAQLIRGSGLDGLCAMAEWSCPTEWSASIPLIRPLLTLRRAEIEAWLAARKISAVVDRTNSDLAYTRSRIRWELLPSLQASFNPNIVETLNRCASALGPDRDYLNQAAERAFARIVRFETANTVVLDREKFRAEMGAIQARLIRRMAKLLGGFEDGLTQPLILRAARFADIDEPSGGFRREDWTGGKTLFLRGNAFGIADASVPTGALPIWDWAAMAAADTAAVVVDGDYPVGNIRLRFEWREVENAAEIAALIEEMKRDPGTVYLDVGRIRGTVRVRPRLSRAERFVPYGMNGTEILLEKFLLNRKVPAIFRDGYPLVSDDEGILWVVGLRAAERASLAADSRRVLRIRRLSPDSGGFA